jgi:TonB family protein
MQAYGKGRIPREVAVKPKVFFAFFLAGTLMVAYPRRVFADKTEKRFKHAAEIFRAGDLENAERELEEILHAKPDYARAGILLGLIHFRLGQNAEQGGDRVRATSEVREALRLEPDEAYWHSELAKLLKEQGDAEGAAKECAQAAKLSPDDSGLASGCGLKASAPSKGEGGENQQDWYGAFKVGGEISPPIPTHRPEPPYAEKARLVGLQGTTVLWVLVDSRGYIERARVVKALGLGLDQSALRTVRTWKFKPAARKGVPVPVRVMVEIGFRLY